MFAAIEPFKNKVNIQTDSTHNNDCNESDTDTNKAACITTDQTTTEETSINGEKNKVTSDLKVDQLQNVMKMTLDITMQNLLTVA